MRKQHICTTRQTKATFNGQISRGHICARPFYCSSRQLHRHFVLQFPQAISPKWKKTLEFRANGTKSVVCSLPSVSCTADRSGKWDCRIWKLTRSKGGVGPVLVRVWMCGVCVLRPLRRCTCSALFGTWFSQNLHGGCLFSACETGTALLTISYFLSNLKPTHTRQAAKTNFSLH